MEFLLLSNSHQINVVDILFTLSTPKTKTMLISNFELLVKRIAPLSGVGPVDAAFRRVVQGYFLNVTNLETDDPLILQVRYTFPAIDDLDAFDRELQPDVADPNVVLTFDKGDINNADLIARSTSVLPVTSARSVITDPFLIEPLETASVKLLPNLANPNVLNTANLEIRGYAEILLIQILGSSQSRVLLTPEIRGTFLDNAYPTGNPTDELDFDQINYALPLASGQAENTIDPNSILALEALTTDGLNRVKKLVKDKKTINLINRKLKLVGMNVTEA